MSDTFLDRLTELEHRVGRGDLTGSVVVDQVYAQYQHEGLDLHHPEGGQAKYLETPAFQGASASMRRLADSLFEPNGLTQAMIRNSEHLAGQVFEFAPVEFGDLKASGNPRVFDDGHKVYDRPPAVHRLTEAELRAKGQVRNLGLGNR